MVARHHASGAKALQQHATRNDGLRHYLVEQAAEVNATSAQKDCVMLARRRAAEREKQASVGATGQLA